MKFPDIIYTFLHAVVNIRNLVAWGSGETIDYFTSLGRGGRTRPNSHMRALLAPQHELSKGG
jgi:hypothetical protein